MGAAATINSRNIWLQRRLGFISASWGIEVPRDEDVKTGGAGTEREAEGTLVRAQVNGLSKPRRTSCSRSLFQPLTFAGTSDPPRDLSHDPPTGGGNCDGIVLPIFRNKDFGTVEALQSRHN